MGNAFRGIFSIAYTPFDLDGDLLWDDFQSVCDWVARSGAHGLVWPVMASEYTVISYPERVRAMNIATKTVAGRIPVVIGVADTSKAGAVSLAEEASKAGADAVIAMPPWATKMASLDMVRDYYRAIAEAAQIPVFIQNLSGVLGSGLSAEVVVGLCRDIPMVQYLKEEKQPQGHSTAEVIALGEPAVKGVFSGSACLWTIPEYRRGISGNMPGSYVPDIDSQIWDLLEAGQEAKAREIHGTKLILENSMRCIPYPQAAKEVLVRRGIISVAAARNGAHIVLDDVDRAEFEYGLSVVSQYFRE